MAIYRLLSHGWQTEFHGRTKRSISRRDTVCLTDPFASIDKLIMSLWFCVPTWAKGCHFWIIITSFIKLTFSYTDLFSTLGATVYNLWPLFMEMITKSGVQEPCNIFPQRLKHGRKTLKGPWMVSWSTTTRWSRAWSLSTNIPAPKQKRNSITMSSKCV